MRTSRRPQVAQQLMRGCRNMLLWWMLLPQCGQVLYPASWSFSRFCGTHTGGRRPKVRPRSHCAAGRQDRRDTGNHRNRSGGYSPLLASLCIRISYIRHLKSRKAQCLAAALHGCASPAMLPFQQDTSWTHAELWDFACCRMALRRARRRCYDLVGRRSAASTAAGQRGFPAEVSHVGTDWRGKSSYKI